MQYTLKSAKRAIKYASIGNSINSTFYKALGVGICMTASYSALQDFSVGDYKTCAAKLGFAIISAFYLRHKIKESNDRATGIITSCDATITEIETALLAENSKEF